MYAILGDIKFQGYKGFSDFSGSNETVLSEHAVIEGKPRLQMTGEKLEEITLKFLLHSTYTNPEKDLETLQEYRRTGAVLPFIAGDGYNYGDFVIKTIGRSMTQTNDSGAIIGIEIDITLIESYVPGQKSKTGKLAVKEPTLGAIPGAPRPSDPQKMAIQMKTINTQSAAMDKELKDAERVPSKKDSALRKAKERIEKIRKSLQVFEQVGDNTRDVISLYASAKGQAHAVTSQVEALAIFVADGDLHSAVEASAQLRNATGKLYVDAAPINSLVGVRRDKESPVVDGGTTLDFTLDGTFLD